MSLVSPNDKQVSLSNCSLLYQLDVHTPGDPGSPIWKNTEMLLAWFLCHCVSQILSAAWAKGTWEYLPPLDCDVSKRYIFIGI